MPKWKSPAKAPDCEIKITDDKEGNALLRELLADFAKIVETPERLRWIRTLACRAYWTSVTGRAGPVHLNFAFREPLVPPGDLDVAAALHDRSIVLHRATTSPLSAANARELDPNASNPARIASPIANMRLMLSPPGVAGPADATGSAPRSRRDAP